MNDPELKILQAAKIQSSSLFFPCLFPGCSGTSTLCHSQQRGRYLKRIARDNYVYSMIDDPVFYWVNRTNNTRRAKFSQVPIRKASTFMGFCNHHDSELFRPVERNPFNPRNPHHIWCCHLRAMAHGYSQKRLHTIRLQMTVQEGKIYPESFIDELMNLVAKVERFHQQLLLPLFSSEAENSIPFVYRQIPQRLPVSVVSIFTPLTKDVIESGLADGTEDLLATATLSVFPNKDTTDVLLTWNHWACPFIDRFRSEMCGYDPASLESFLNRIIFNYSEDYCLAPDFYEQLPKSTKQQLQSALTFVNGMEETLPVLPIIHFEENTLNNMRRANQQDIILHDI